MPQPKTSLIHAAMPILEIVTFCPGAKPVLAEYGLHCFNCAGSEFETLEQGCLSHGFGREEIDELVEDLNDMLHDQPPRPQTLTITKDAALAIGQVANEEKRDGEGLAVIVDAGGGFCMEFRPEPQHDETIFQNAEVPSVRIFASSLTLARIGGSTIDFRDGRFKLDLPPGDSALSACGCDGEACKCGKKV